MDEKEIKTLAVSVASTLYSNFGNRDSEELMAGEFEVVITEILKTHCIVSKRKIEEIYEESKRCWLEEIGKPVKQSSSCAEIHQLQTLFGKEIFETINNKTIES